MTIEQKEKDERQDPRIVSTTAVYEYCHKILNLKPRTLQWYATEGLIPKPTKRGREAYYNISKTQIYPRVHIIVDFQKKFELRLWEIRDILKKYEKQDLGALLLLLQNLHENYPDFEYDDSGNGKRIQHNVNVRKVFFDKLREGVPVSRLSLVEAEKEAEDLDAVPF